LDKYIEFDGEKYLKKYGKRLYKLLLKEFNWRWKTLLRRLPIDL
jgi:hypothetical protein